MIGIVLISHGSLSEQLVATASMIMGSCSDVKYVTFSSKESLDDLRRKANEAVEPYENEGCLILTDLIGGSANNISIELLKTKKNIQVVTGVNLPMLLEAIGYRSIADDLNDLTVRVQASGAKSIINLKEFFEKRAAKK